MEEPKYLAKMSLLLLEINSIQKRFGERGYFISTEGLAPYDRFREEEMSKSILTNANKIIDILHLLDTNHIFKHASSYSMCSYGIKHIIEDAWFARIKRQFPSLGENCPCSYVSNGIGILCMILKGYEFKMPPQRNSKKPVNSNIMFKIKLDKNMNL